MALVSDDFESMIDRFSDEAKDALRGSADTDDKKNSLIDDYNNYNPPVYSNYIGFEDSFNEYYSRDDKNYGSGTNHYVSAIIAYNTAKGKADFYDPKYSIKRTNSDGSKSINDGIKDCNSSKLMFGHVAMYDTNNSFSGELLEEILQADKLKDKKMVVMPLGLAEGEHHHAVSLILNPETNDALLIDQGGKDTGYSNAKEELRKLLKDNGYNNITEPDRVMENRMDCAIFAAMVNEEAISRDSFSEITSWLDQFRNKSNDEKRNEVDKKNGEYKKDVLSVYIEDYKNNPLFKAYAEYKNINLAAMTNEDVLEEINKFAKIKDFTVSENIQDNDLPPADPEWAKEVEDAIKKANAKTHNEFERFENPDHPQQVFFRDKNNNNNVIAFASRSKAYVSGEQNAFDELVAAAQKLGKETIRFGEFEHHPENKAKLYLACLRNGMEMVGNVPSEEELKASPEYDAIKVERDRAKIKEEYEGTKKVRDDKENDWKNDPLYSALENAVKNAQAKFDADQTEENKKALDQAKEYRQNNPRYSAYDEARNAHIESSKKMLDLYLDHGLKPFDNSSAEERKKHADEFLGALENRGRGSGNKNREVEQKAIQQYLADKTK